MEAFIFTAEGQLPWQLTRQRKMILRFNHHKICFQVFSFPNPMIYYLMKAANSKQLQILQKLCKYFYAKNKVIVLDYFKAFTVGKKDPKFLDFANVKFWFTRELELKSIRNFHQLRDKIFKSNVINLKIWVKGKFTMSDLKLLGDPEILKKLDLGKYIYCNFDDETLVPIEDILYMFPNVSDIRTVATHVTSETGKKLFQMERKEKFKQCSFGSIDNKIDFSLLLSFLKKNARGYGASVSFNNREDNIDWMHWRRANA